MLLREPTPQVYCPIYWTNIIFLKCYTIVFIISQTWDMTQFPSVFNHIFDTFQDQSVPLATSHKPWSSKYSF